MTVVVLLLIVSFLTPMQIAKKKENLKCGYIFEVEQTTGPWWRVKEIIADENNELRIGDLVYVQGYDPYEKLKNSIISSRNSFYFDISKVEVVYDDELEEEFKKVYVENWGICYPIKREFINFGFRKKILTSMILNGFSERTSWFKLYLGRFRNK